MRGLLGSADTSAIANNEDQGLEQRFLVVHDNKLPHEPRLSVLTLFPDRRTFNLTPVRVDKRLSGSQDLEAVFLLPARTGAEETTIPPAMYVATQSNGKSYVFTLSSFRTGIRATTHGTFKLKPPMRGVDVNIEGVRSYVSADDDHTVMIEYANRGGLVEDASARMPAWIVQVPWDASRRRPAHVKTPGFRVAHIQPFLSDPRIRQVSDLGCRANGNAQYGNVDAAAYDDEKTERDFFSYLYTRRPPLENGRGSSVVPTDVLFRVPRHKIEAVIDLDDRLTMWASDDESQGGVVALLNRTTGAQLVMLLDMMGGATSSYDTGVVQPKQLGISGIAPLEITPRSGNRSSSTPDV